MTTNELPAGTHALKGVQGFVEIKKIEVAKCENGYQRLYDLWLHDAHHYAVVPVNGTTMRPICSTETARAVLGKLSSRPIGPGGKLTQLTPNELFECQRANMSVDDASGHLINLTLWPPKGPFDVWYELRDKLIKHIAREVSLALNRELFDVYAEIDRGLATEP